MKDNIYTICYAGILGIVCSLLLTATAQFAAPHAQASASSEEMANILAILKVPVAAGADAKQLIKIYKANITEEKRGGLTVYLYRRPGQRGIEAAAFPFSGPGLWGPIKGFLALEPDMKTIRGISFYQQEETPGLGGEIASDWFQKQFVGKSIVGKNGKSGIIISKSKGKAEPNHVDAITGATMTSNKVEDMLNKIIDKIVKEAD